MNTISEFVLVKHRKLIFPSLTHKICRAALDKILGQIVHDYFFNLVGFLRVQLVPGTRTAVSVRHSRFSRLSHPSVPFLSKLSRCSLPVHSTLVLCVRSATLDCLVCRPTTLSFLLCLSRPWGSEPHSRLDSDLDTFHHPHFFVLDPAATMKITATTTTSARSSMYSKRRSPSPTTLVSLTKRRESPLTNSLRRTPPQLVSVEMQRQAQLQMGKAEREMQALLEVDYRDDVKLYMYEMEVSPLRAQSPISSVDRNAKARARQRRRVPDPRTSAEQH